MSLYPFNQNLTREIQTHIKGAKVGRGFIASFHADNVAAAASDSVLPATGLIAQATTITTGITQPDHARVLQVKGNAPGITGDVVIAGTNLAGRAISETITANGNTAVTGTKAFKTITRITLPARNAGGDTISIGVNNKLGIPFKLQHDTVLMASLGNVREAILPTVTFDALNVENNTVELNSSLNGKNVDIYLIA